MPKLSEIQKKLKKESRAIALGNFDGVHLGHQAVFAQLKKIAAEKKLKPFVLVLFPHPKEIFTGSSPALLTTIEIRKELIRSLGIEVDDLTFDLSLAEIQAQDLLQTFKKDLGMQHLVIGPTTHIGKNREGTPSKIVEFSQAMDFGISVVDQLEVKGCKVSSSVIREYISKGDLRLVADLLGRFYSTRGVVETGQGKGRGIGFPTANIHHIQTMVPGRGVYAGYVHLQGQRHKAAINVGMRPTVTSDKTLVVEAHLIDFDQKIVGHELIVDWVERLREEVKFGSIDELKVQIQRDVRKARDIL